MNIHERAYVCVPTGLDASVWAVGDTHAGDGGPADDFAPRADLFYEFAARVGWRNIRWVGDCFEGWQCERGAINAQYPTFCHAVRTGLGVRGNHDMRINPLPLVYREGDVVFAHGHAADIWNSHWRWLGRLATRIVGWMERRGWQNADNPSAWFARKVPSRMGSVEFKAIRKRYRDWAYWMFGKYLPSTLLYGHTHRTYITQLTHLRVIANVGTWASDGCKCAAIRLDPDRVTQLEILP